MRSALPPAMASSTKNAETTIYFFLGEELFNGATDHSASSSGTIMMAESLWGLMREELVERVLLFLPVPSQARFRIVCKRWKELMTSSKEFRKQSALIAFRRGYPVCTLRFEPSQFDMDRYKMLKLRFRGLVLPRGDRSVRVVFSQPGLPVVAVACDDCRSNQVQCWLLNLADQSWRELPLLPNHEPSLCWEMSMWLVPEESTSTSTFKFLAMQTHIGSWSRKRVATYFHSYDESTSTDWRALAAPEGTPGVALHTCTEWREDGASGSVVFKRSHEAEESTESWVSWEGKCINPFPPRPLPPRLPQARAPLDRDEFQVLSKDGYDGDCVFAYGNEGYKEGLYLHKWDGSRRRWECLFSQQLPPADLRRLDFVLHVRGQIVGNLVLLTAAFHNPCTYELWTMAYHTLEGTRNWFRPSHDPYFLHLEHKVAFVSPSTVVS